MMFPHYLMAVKYIAFSPIVGQPIHYSLVEYIQIKYEKRVLSNKDWIQYHHIFTPWGVGKIWDELFNFKEFHFFLCEADKKRIQIFHNDLQITFFYPFVCISSKTISNTSPGIMSPSLVSIILKISNNKNSLKVCQQ